MYFNEGKKDKAIKRKERTMALQLGVSRRDITPQIGGNLYGYYPDLYSTTLHDSLDVTALVFACGEQKAVVVSATICLLNTELADEIRTLIEKKTGIPADHVIISVTHTHTGPNTAGSFGWGEIDRAYCNSIFVPQILAAVKEAAEQLTPVRVGIATGQSHIGMNRREFFGDNQIRLGQNPWGCYNPKMTVLSFKDDKDQVVANIVHYGNHGTAAGKHTAISRDWPGVMCDAMEAATGGCTVFLNGPEGDVGPRISNGKTIGDDGMKYVIELGQKAAEDAIRVYRGIETYEDMDMDIQKGTIHLPLKKRISLEEANAGLQKYAGNARNLGGQYAHYYEKVIASYEEGYEDQRDLPLPQWLFRIGDTVFVSSGYELFSEIGLRIQQMCDRKNVLCLSMTNGSDGYFATESAVCLGGYEVGMFLTGRCQPFVEHADWHFIKETIRNIDENLK